MNLKEKQTLVIVLILFVFFSCRTKKTFSGSGELPCADHNEEIIPGKEEKDKTKRGKTRLFKKK